MKKSLIVLSVSALMFALVFTGCSNGNTAEMQAKENAKVDSIVNSRLDALKADMQKECDSKVMAAAQAKADSMMSAMKNSSSKSSKSTTSTTKEKSVTVPIKSNPNMVVPINKEQKKTETIKANPNLKMVPKPLPKK